MKISSTELLLIGGQGIELLGVTMQPLYTTKGNYLHKNSTLFNFHNSLRPESAENIPLGFQGFLYFLKQNFTRNLKMGLKQSITGPPNFEAKK